MASRGETVKYVIDADTSGFSRGMAEAELVSKVAGRKIDSNLSRTAKNSENNFNDIRRTASTAANSIRNFGVAFRAFDTTSAIIGVTALTGVVLELAGAFAAATSSAFLFLPALTQGIAAVTTYKTGISGLGDAFKAISANDGKKFTEALGNLSPAARQLAYAAAGVNNAFNGIKFNVQQAMFKNLGKTMLDVAGNVLPILNAGMQQVGESFNGVFNQAAQLMSSPLFKGTLATIFADTANNVDILAGALGPILDIFSKLYLITAPYVTLLAQQFVNLTKNVSAYLDSAKGQSALNASIQYGLVALKQLGAFASSVFSLLTSLFRTSVSSGTSLISTLTDIVDRMTDWVNSGEGQARLQALFNFTSIAVTAVADALGRALNAFFAMVQIVDSLNPAVQGLIVNFLATSLVVRPLITYIGQLYLAVRVLIVSLFNVVQQAIVVFAALGAISSVVVVVAAALITIGAIIRGPLGGALIFIGVAIATYIGLTYLLGSASTYTAGTFLYQGAAALQLSFTEAELASMQVLLATTMYNSATAAVAAGAGMGFAARAAVILQAAILPLIALAAGLFVILSLLGLFSGKAKSASTASMGLGSSLGGLQKAMKGVGTSSKKTSAAGITPMANNLDKLGDSADKATSSLASFDKMNVLTENSTSGAGIDAGGIGGVPSVPNLDGVSLGSPTIDTGDFDDALADMQKGLSGLTKDLNKKFPNPFQSLADWINTHPWIMLGILVGILTVIIALFVALALTVGIAVLPVTVIIALIVVAIAALIAIVIILWKNWDTVWAAIKNITSTVVEAIAGFFSWLWDGISNGVSNMVKGVSEFFVNLWNDIKLTYTPVVEFFVGIFKGAWDGIVGIWNAAVGFFNNIFESVKTALSFYITIYVSLFKLAWEGIVAIWNAASGFFGSVWTNIKNAFGTVVGFFGNVFSSAWESVKSAFSGVSGFFRGVWDTIVGIFGSVGTAIGNAVGGSFKGIINTAINMVTDFVNNTIKLINGALNVINKIPGVNIKTISTISLPRLAKGGIVSSPMIAQIGEAGAEAVMPLENNTEWIDKLAAKINSANGQNGGQPLQLVVKIGEETITTTVVDLINERSQMSGRNQIMV